jgi:hypothetical protein
VHNGQCCPPTYVAPGCEPPCPRGEIRLPNGQCCPPDKVYNGACYHPVPRVNVLPHCPRGTIRLGDGSCGHERPIVRIPGRLHIDKPPHHRPEKPQKTPKRERTVTPNWKPTGGTTRLNTFHPQIQGGGGMGGGGTHRGR